MASKQKIIGKASKKVCNKQQIAIVAQDIFKKGGIQSVVRFLLDTINNSEIYEPHLISLATSRNDAASFRLLHPTTWKQGARILKTKRANHDMIQVGAWCVEFEFFRYWPRKNLTELLNNFDIIQIVSGAPTLTWVTRDALPPKCVFVATTSRAERATILKELHGVRKYWSGLMTHVNTKIESKALPQMSHIFAESNYTMELLSDWVPQKKMTLGIPGVDTKTFYPSEIFTPNNYILSVGRFADPRKNVRLLFDSYSKLRQTLPEAPKLVLAGLSQPKEEDWNYAKKLGIFDFIEMYEKVSIEKLAFLYRNASIFLLSSNEEGLGIVILEAMASGLPVVSTNSGGPATIIEHGKTGYLTPVGDSESLVLRLRELISDTDKAETFGRNGKELVDARFSIEAAGRAYIEVYRSLREKTLI